jgi:uncharacterized protein involved in exopolysaccharide biosynthesis
VTPGADTPRLDLLRGSSRLILLGAGAVALLVLMGSLLLPSWYRSTVKLLPEVERQRIAATSQLADLARLAGSPGVPTDPGRLYAVVLASDGLLRTAVATRYATASAESLDLCMVFGMDGEARETDLQDAVEELRDLLSVQYDARTGVITMSVDMPEPRLAAEVLEVLVRELDVFMRQKRKTVAAEQRSWIEGRLVEVRRELRVAEESLTRFREKNRRVVDSPELLLEQERLLRDVEMKAGILAELTRQHELARIEEIKDIGMVNVVDDARPPARRERPRPLTNALVAFFVSLAAGSAGVALFAPLRRRSPS